MTYVVVIIELDAYKINLHNCGPHEFSMALDPLQSCIWIESNSSKSLSLNNLDDQWFGFVKFFNKKIGLLPVKNY